MLKPIFKALGGLITGGGWVAIPCCISLFFLVKTCTIEPLRATIANQEITIADQDTLLLQRQHLINSTQLLVKDMKGKIDTDSMNYATRERQFQHTIKDLTSRNRQLATGVRVDLVRLEYFKPLFGQEKLRDSTYQTAWKWGE